MKQKLFNPTTPLPPTTQSDSSHAPLFLSPPKSPVFSIKAKIGKITHLPKQNVHKFQESSRLITTTVPNSPTPFPLLDPNPPNPNPSLPKFKAKRIISSPKFL